MRRSLSIQLPGYDLYCVEVETPPAHYTENLYRSNDGVAVVVDRISLCVYADQHLVYKEIIYAEDKIPPVIPG